MPDSEVKTRLLDYLHYKRMTQREFARRLGVSYTYIGAMRRSISTKKMNEIRAVFPDLNTSWLLFGEGEMILDSAMPEEEATTALSRSGRGRDPYDVPLLPVAAYAGNLQMWSDGVALADCEHIKAPMQGVDYAIRVSGDSMEPKLENGSILFIKRINDRAFIPWGSILVLDTENGVLVKCVYPSDHKAADQTTKELTAGAAMPEYIEARSLNPRYPAIQIPTSSIYGIYRLLAHTSIYNTL